MKQLLQDNHTAYDLLVEQYQEVAHAYTAAKDALFVYRGATFVFIALSIFELAIMHLK